jgi:PAS domain S-box-containing protein
MPHNTPVPSPHGDHREREWTDIVLETAPVLIVVLDRQGRIVRFNRACEETTGYRFDEVSGQHIWDLFLIELEAASVRQVFHELVDTALGGTHTNYWKTKAGGLRLIEWTNTVLRDEAGAAQWIVAAGRDITQLRQSEETARALLNATDDATYLLDTAGQILALNEAGARRLKRPLAELLGQDLYRLLPPDLAQSRRLIIEEVVRTGRAQQLEYVQDGAHLESHVYPIHDDTGAICRIGVYSRDITHHKRAEEQIVHLNSVLKAIRDINQIIRVERDRSRLLQACCEALISGRGYQAAWLVTCDPSGKLGELYAQGMGEKLPALQGIIRRQELPPCARGAFAHSGVMVWVTHDRPCENCELASLGPCPTRMTAALAHAGRSYGLLCVCLPRGMQASEEEQGLLRELAEDIALALYLLELGEAEADAQRDLALERERLEALLTLAHMFEASTHDLVDFTLEEAVRLTGSKLGYIAFASEDESVLTMYSWSKTAMKECAIIEKPIEYPVITTGLWGEAVRQRQPIVTNDYAAPNPLKQGYPEGHVQIQRHMNVPVFDGPHIVAVAGVGNKETDYDDNDVRQLTLLMNGLWRHLQQRQVEEELRRLNLELEQRVVERTGELQHSNQELRQSERKFRALFDRVSDPIFIYDPDGRILEVNRVACERFGYSRRKLLQMNMRDLHTPEAAAQLPEMVEHVRRGGHLVTETNYRRADGSSMPVELSSSLIRYEGRPALLTTARDTSQRQQAEESQRMAAVGQLAAGVSHEFKNVLAAMSAQAQVARLQRTPDATAQLADTVRRMTARGTEICRNLISFARPGEPVREALAMEDQVEAALALATRELENAQVTVQRDYRALPRLVHAEAVQIQQVLLNLILNACAAMPDGGTLTVRTAVETHPEGQAPPGGADQVVVRITDTGVGIAPEDLPHVFEPFFSARGSRGMADHPASGLGLSVSQGLIQAHGGTLTIESEPGRGATGTVRLAALPEGTTLAETPAQEEAPTPTRGEGRVLLVEDEADIRSAVAALLADRGFEVIEAGTLPEGLRLAARQRCKAIVSDLMLPGGDGRRLLELVEHMIAPPSVVFITGKSEADLERKLMSAGAAAVIPKPFDVEELVSLVLRLTAPAN